jgi:competence protein ComGC
MSEPEKKSSGVTLAQWVALGLLIGLLVAAAIPNFIKPHVKYAANACVNNLRCIDAAAQQFALEKHKTNGESINYPDDLTPYIKLNSHGKIPPCPQGGIYSIKKVGDTPTCSLGTTVTPAHVLP